jgi:hypothetical protein
MNGYNNYSQPLIVPQDFMNYLSLSKHIFPQQWVQGATGICNHPKSPMYGKL